MRSDPYLERVRELAIEAGLDPDAKIDRPGQRPMPLGCTFRDAARREHLVREADVVATDIAIAAGGPISEQPAEGLRQARRRHDRADAHVSVGNAVAGVICADGHLGYAHRRRDRR
jgi:tRNA-splicing ligase RtcB